MLNDPLSNNNKAYQWQEGNQAIGSCAFQGGAYYDSVSQPGRFNTCIALASHLSSFSNFTYEVQMTIILEIAAELFSAGMLPNFYDYPHVCRWIFCFYPVLTRRS